MMDVKERIEGLKKHFKEDDKHKEKLNNLYKEISYPLRHKIDSLIPIHEYNEFNRLIVNIAKELQKEEPFEISDIKEYLKTIIDETLR